MFSREVPDDVSPSRDQSRPRHSSGALQSVSPQAVTGPASNAGCSFSPLTLNRQPCAMYLVVSTPRPDCERSAALLPARQGGSCAAATQPQLSPRMLSCLRWASEGKSSVDIGQLLGISPRTVDDYLTESRRRLGVRTRVQAVLRAVALGLLDDRPG